MATLGILSCGELGTAFAAVMISQGWDVVTAGEGRSEATRRSARGAGVRELVGVSAVVRSADIVLSLVTPRGAEAVASQYLQARTEAPPGAIFVDANSVGPATITRIAERFAASEVPFVDAALVGPASRLTTSSTLYLSGRPAARVAGLLAPAIRAKVLGEHAGEASSLKMLLGGMNKGLAALFLEIALAADTMKALPGFLQEYKAGYPEVMSLIERMVPTYAVHARRRGEEVREIEEMLTALGRPATVVAGTCKMIESIAQLDLARSDTAEALVRQITRSAPPPPGLVGRPDMSFSLPPPH